MNFVLHNIRQQFPLLSQTINGHPLIYLDSAATTQKPQCVLDAMKEYYEHENANVKRGVHVMAERATNVYEDARKRVQKFVNAEHAREIIFTKSATESINLVARSYGESLMKKSDVILLSLLDHHSNIVPWMQLKEKIGVEIKWIGIHEDGALKMEDAEKILKTGNVKMMCIPCVSNVLGTHTDYMRLTKLAHAHGATVLLDAAQLAPHEPIDVQAIDCDFLAFSGHKVYGPMGVGVLYGKEKLLNEMPPFLGGGGMVESVTVNGFRPTHIPEKFEAGTPPVAEARGLHAALDFLTGVGWGAIQKHEHELIAYALKKLSELQFVHILGPKNPKKILGCISFIISSSQNLQTSKPLNPGTPEPLIHPHDLTEFCGRKGVCMRAGHHCAQPLHDALGIPATTRMSFGMYNAKEDIDRACEVIEEAYAFFQHGHLR